MFIDLPMITIIWSHLISLFIWSQLISIISVHLIAIYFTWFCYIAQYNTRLIATWSQLILKFKFSIHRMNWIFYSIKVFYWEVNLHRCIEDMSADNKIWLCQSLLDFIGSRNMRPVLFKQFFSGSIKTWSS